MDRGGEAEDTATGSTRRDDADDVVVVAPASGRRDIKFTIVPSRVLRILLLVIAVLVALSTATRMIALYLPDFPLRDSTANLLYVDFEQSLPTLFSTLMMLVGALLCAGIAHGRSHQGTSDVRHWAALSVIFGLLAIDEFASLHEQLTEPLRRLLDIEGGLLLWAWVVPAVAVSVFVVFFLPFLGRLPRSTRRGLWTGGFLVRQRGDPNGDVRRCVRFPSGDRHYLRAERHRRGNARDAGHGRLPIHPACLHPGRRARRLVDCPGRGVRQHGRRRR
jgi:hypothetical protein